MDINNLSYIKIPTSDLSLKERIELTYIMNGREKTFEHVKSVAETNVKIAMQYQLDLEKCLLAGLLHDISCVMKPEDMTIYATFLEMSLDEAEKRYPFLLHQKMSNIFIEKILMLKDSDILSAVECHTTLKRNASKYDMALFIADKISWDQDGRPPFYDKVISSLLTSLESACLEYINYMLENNLILYPHKWFLEAKVFLEESLI